MAKSISEQIDRIRSLKVGWFDGDGNIPTPEGLDWLQLKVEEFFGVEGMPPPYIYPTAEGKVQIEWDTKNEISLEIDVENKYAELYSTKDDEIGYVIIPDLKSDTGWKWISKKIIQDRK